jgi:hypothetical protein
VRDEEGATRDEGREGTRHSTRHRQGQRQGTHTLEVKARDPCPLRLSPAALMRGERTNGVDQALPHYVMRGRRGPLLL